MKIKGCCKHFEKSIDTGSSIQPLTIKERIYNLIVCELCFLGFHFQDCVVIIFYKSWKVINRKCEGHCWILMRIEENKRTFCLLKKKKSRVLYIASKNSYQIPFSDIFIVKIFAKIERASSPNKMSNIQNELINL